MSDWKIIHGFEDYEVSRHGQVRRATAGRGTTIGQIIKPHTQTSTGYPDVRLRKDGRTYSMAIHRLVAAAFLGNKPEGQQIRHLDGNRLNASAENLRYGTAIENAQDKIRHGRSFFTGASNPKAKITAEDAEQIRTLRQSGLSAKAIAAEFGLCKSTVHRTISGAYWKEASNRAQDRTMR